MRTIRNVLAIGHLRRARSRSERVFVTNNGRVSAGEVALGMDMIYKIYRMEDVGGEGVAVCRRCFGREMAGGVGIALSFPRSAWD
jgi:hypothetical protein